MGATRTCQRHSVEGALCHFRGRNLTRRERSFLFLCLNKLSAVLLCVHVADPATFRASNRVLSTLFSSENSLFILLKSKYHYLINIANIEIL